MISAIAIRGIQTAQGIFRNAAKISTIASQGMQPALENLKSVSQTRRSVKETSNATKSGRTASAAAKPKCKLLAEEAIVTTATKSPRQQAPTLSEASIKQKV
jgi:type IV secretory pathway TrbL component